MTDHNEPNMENGWSKAEKLVFYQLKEARKDISKLDEKLELLEKSFVKLKTRVNLYSALGGAGVSVVLTVVINLIIRAI